MRHARAILAGAGLAAGLAAGVLGAAGCKSYAPSQRLMDEVFAGEFGRARAEFDERARGSTGARDELLLRSKAGLLGLADGVPAAAGDDLDRVYEILRTQGINRGTGGGVVVAGEEAARTWKGEPFEQAMMYHTLAVADALGGEWDNARASAGNAIFLLRDFSDVVGERTGLAAREALLEAAAGEEGEGLGLDYAQVASDFEPAYLMQAIAARRLGLPEEMDEALAALHAVAPRLDGLAEVIREGDYNAVVVADLGMAPQKIAAGEDGTLVGYRERSASDGRRLVVTQSGRAEAFPVATDLNRLANDLKWNNLEDVRRAKSALGSALMIGGVGVAALSDDEGAQLAGLGTALAGALLKGTSKADLRHNEILPQRVYIAPVRLEPGRAVTLEVEGRPETRLVLDPWTTEPPADRLALVYARLPGVASEWAQSGVVLYANDAVAEGTDATLPYILGGRDVRTPTRAVLDDYQRAGRLRGMTLEGLLELYREEGIRIADPRDRGQPLGVHILEGGDWLYTPRPGSAGFARLYGQERPAYRARSERVRELSETIGAGWTP